MTAYSNSGSNYGNSGTPARQGDVTVNAAAVTPADQVRWGSIIAGLFTTLATLTVLAVLGVAIGLSSYDAGESFGGWGAAAGWWGAISALIAFFIGGWLAARSAAFQSHRSGLLNGAMVWVTTIPLTLLILAGGLNTIMRSAASASSAMDNQTTTAAGDQGTLYNEAQQAAATVSGNVNTGDVQRAADNSAGEAWGTLLSLLLGLAAAAAGGWIGAKGRDDDRHGASDRRDETRAAAAV